MAPSKTLEVSPAREGAMPEVILPSPFVGLLVAFEPCFSAPSYRTFRLLMAGWILCLGRRTITAVAVASGGVERCHISVFHRFFTRATWSLDALGQAVFRLALAWIPADEPLYVLIDDTLARKTGKGISLATMHHDPLLSSARKPFCSFGHVWVVLAIWVPLPMGGTRGFALPLLFRLYVGAKRGGTKDAPGRPRRGTRQQAAEKAHAAHPRPTKLALARERQLGRRLGRRSDYLRGSRQRLCGPSPPGGPSRERRGAQPAPAGRRPLGPARPAPPRPARPTTQAGPPPADPQGDGRGPPPLGPVAAHPLRPTGHPARLRLHRPLVRRPPRPADPHRDRQRPQWSPPRRGVLLYRPHRRSRLHPGGLRAPVDH